MRHAQIASAALKVTSVASKQLIEGGKITSWTSLAVAALGSTKGTGIADKVTGKVFELPGYLSETTLNYVTPALELAESYIRNDGNLTPANWASAIGSTLTTAVSGKESGLGQAIFGNLGEETKRGLTNLVVAGALYQYDRDAAVGYLENFVGNEVGQLLGHQLAQPLQASTAERLFNGFIKDPTSVSSEFGRTLARSQGFADYNPTLGILFTKEGNPVALRGGSAGAFTAGNPAGGSTLLPIGKREEQEIRAAELRKRLADALGTDEAGLIARFSAVNSAEDEQKLLDDLGRRLVEREILAQDTGARAIPAALIPGITPEDIKRGAQAGAGFVAGIGLSVARTAIEGAEGVLDLGAYLLELQRDVLANHIHHATGGQLFKNAPAQLELQRQRIGEFVENLPTIVKNIPSAIASQVKDEFKMAQMALDDNDLWAAGVLFGKILGDTVGLIVGAGGAVKASVAFLRGTSKGIGEVAAAMRTTNKPDAKAAATVAQLEQAFTKLDLPKPAAPEGYWPKLLEGSSEAQRQAHIRGYIAELKATKDINANPNVSVLKYGDRVGTHGADIISYDSKFETVTLWDSKFRSNPTVIGDSPTFTNPRAHANAVEQARDLISNSALPEHHKIAALRSLETKNYRMITIPAGEVKNASILRPKKPDSI